MELRMPLPFLSPAPSLLESLKLKDMNKPLSHSLAKSCFFHLPPLGGVVHGQQIRQPEKAKVVFEFQHPYFTATALGLLNALL